MKIQSVWLLLGNFTIYRNISYHFTFQSLHQLSKYFEENIRRKCIFIWSCEVDPRGLWFHQILSSFPCHSSPTIFRLPFSLGLSMSMDPRLCGPVNTERHHQACFYIGVDVRKLLSQDIRRTVTYGIFSSFMLDHRSLLLMQGHLW